MRLPNIELVVVLTLLCIWMVYFIYRFYQNRLGVSRQVIVNMMMSVVLALISSTSVRLNPDLWWLYSVSTFFSYCSFVIGYFAIDQLLNDKPYQPIITHKLFLAALALSVVGLILEFLEKDSLISYLKGAPFHPTWVHYVYFALKDGFELYVLILIISLYWRDLHHYRNLTYFVRRILCMLSSVLSIFYILLVDSNLFISLLYGPDRRLHLSQVELTSRLLLFWLLALGFMLPQSFLAWFLRPLDRYLARRQQRRRALLGYLHSKMIQIVPDIYLPVDALQDLRVPIEISDARQIIWSQQPQSNQPITPRDEAEHLFKLLTNNVVLHKPGVYYPPITRYRNITRHNVAVAKHLLKKYHEESRGHDRIKPYHYDTPLLRLE